MIIPNFRLTNSAFEISTYLSEVFNKIAYSEQLKVIKYKIGSWDMDTVSSKTIDISKLIKVNGWKNIVNWSATILKDDQTEQNVGQLGFDSGLSKNDLTFVLYRTAIGIFDNNDHNDVTINRGFLFLWVIT